jgi:hypothetical protein
VILWKYESNSLRSAMGVAEPPRGYGLALGFIAATTGNDRAGKQQLISPRLFPTVQRTGEHERSQKQRFMKIAGQT